MQVKCQVQHMQRLQWDDHSMLCTSTRFSSSIFAGLWLTPVQRYDQKNIHAIELKLCTYCSILCGA
jgi:hypothetical protein